MNANPLLLHGFEPSGSPPTGLLDVQQQRELLLKRLASVNAKASQISGVCAFVCASLYLASIIIFFLLLLGW